MPGKYKKSLMLY